jgi:hypothetical protein
MAPSVLARIAVILGVALGAGALAASAAGASLSVSVSPLTVRPGHRYTVTVRGRYGTRREKPYLVAFIQYSGRRCRATATAEYALPTSEWDFDVYPQPEARSPFKKVTYWTASASVGARRVCAYLYAHRPTPATTVKPLVRAGAAFRDARQ